MTTQLITVDEHQWATQIQTVSGGSFDFVGVAADLAAAQANQVASPGCWVMPAQDSARSNLGAAGMVIQDVTSLVAVTLHITASDALRAGAVSSMRALRTAVLQALLGWQPDPHCGAIEFRRGRPVLAAGTSLWWQDIYELPWQLRKTV